VKEQRKDKIRGKTGKRWKRRTGNINDMNRREQCNLQKRAGETKKAKKERKSELGKRKNEKGKMAKEEGEKKKGKKKKEQDERKKGERESGKRKENEIRTVSVFFSLQFHRNVNSSVPPNLIIILLRPAKPHNKRLAILLSGTP
jgi:hypothetical protein